MGDFMCDKLVLGSEEFDNIIINIKNNNLSRSNLPKLVVGTGLSASFNVPGMVRLAEQLNKELSIHPQKRIQDLWNLKAADIKSLGLEEGLKSISSTECDLVDEIKKVTALFILEEEEKLHDIIIKQDSGFSKLLSYLRDTCSVNNGILDIMTPNYDRIIEIICDKLKIKVVSGFEGELYKEFFPGILKNPYSLYSNKNFYIRLFKPHGSLNWINMNGKEFLSNDYDILKRYSDYIEIITPGSFKYEAGLINNTFRIMREDFNELISDVIKPYSLLIYGYGFNDPHFNTVLFQNTNKNILIISRDVNKDVLDKAMKNPYYTVFYQESTINFMIYKCKKYQVDLSLWDMNVFAETFIG